MSTDTRIMIVGAGLAGALMACYLARRRYRVDMFERRPDPRAAGFAGGRSINLALSARGLHALERVGLDEVILADGIPMRGRMMHAESGTLTFQPYSKNPDDAINSVSRGGLNITMLEAAAAHENVSLHFGQRCLDVDLDEPSARFLDEVSGAERTAEADLIIGADGAFSAVRGRLQKLDRFEYSQSYLEHGYRELCIPPAAGGGFAMEPNALHIWPRGGSMMIALPNRDRTFTCTLFWPFSRFEAVQSEGEILAFFRRHFADAVPLMPALVDDYTRNPIGSLVTIRCRPWHYRDKAILIGDAAHAIVPFYGQGINAGFEDCVALDEAIEAHAPDWERVLGTVSEGRRNDADAIADMALHNFIEMRDHVGSAAFLFRKKLETLLHRVFPNAFLPLYNMVSFSLIPYAEARDRAGRQGRTIRRALLAALAVAALAVAVGLWRWLAR